MLSKNQVRTPEQALIYLADCNLATVADLAMKKSRSKSEYARQIGIAQTNIDWIIGFKIEPPKGSRVADIIALPDKKVETWAKSYLCA